MLETGSTIGHIRLAEPLGEGGMGTVWAGFHQKLRREVAVKTLRADRVGSSARARFLSEARILSHLDHPNICRVHDYIDGEESDYLVLERIRGRTLEGVIEEGGLAWAQKLQIAEQIAGALAVAHSRGVIHRDLKPSNVMLNDEGEVRVLDFGLAQRLGTDEEDEVPAAAKSASSAGGASPAPPEGTLTRLASLVLEHDKGITGTPSAMSPEQARGESVTAASDMYAFGLLLQRLLTGRPAHPPELLAAELVVRAREAESLPAHGLDAETGRLVEALKSPRPEQRPTAAEALTALRRRRDRPRRWRLGVAVVAGLALLAAGGVKYTVDLRAERNQALAAQRTAEAARLEADEVANFLIRLFDDVQPWNSTDKRIEVRDLLDRGRESVAELEDQPAVQARLERILAEIYLYRDEVDLVVPLLQSSLETSRRLFGSQSLEVAEVLYPLAHAYGRQEKYQDALKVAQQAVAIRERHPDPDRAVFAASLIRLGIYYLEVGDREGASDFAHRGHSLLEEYLADPIHPDYFEFWHELSSLYIKLGQNRENEPILRRLIHLLEISKPPKPFFLADLSLKLSMIHYEKQEIEDAASLARRAMEIHREISEREHPFRIAAVHNLARILDMKGELSEAETLAAEAAASWRKFFSDEHTNVAAALHIISTCRRSVGDLEGSLTAANEAIAIQRKHGDSWYISRALAERARTLAWQGDAAGAERDVREAIDLLEQGMGAEHYDMNSRLLQLAEALSRQGKTESAEELLDRVEHRLAKVLKDEPANMLYRRAQSLLFLERGRIETDRGNADRAAMAWRRSLEALAPILNAPTISLDNQDTYVQALLHLGRIEEARPAIERLRAAGWRNPRFLALCREHGC